MPKVRRSSYNLAFKLKVVAEAEAVENNSEIARDYGISESMVRRWRKDSGRDDEKIVQNVRDLKRSRWNRRRRHLRRRNA